MMIYTDLLYLYLKSKHFFPLSFTLSFCPLRQLHLDSCCFFFCLEVFGVWQHFTTWNLVINWRFFWSSSSSSTVRTHTYNTPMLGSLGDDDDESPSTRKLRLQGTCCFSLPLAYYLHTWQKSWKLLGHY